MQELLLSILNLFFSLAAYVLFLFLMHSKFERKFKSKFLLVVSAIAFIVICLVLFNLISRTNNMLTFILYAAILYLYSIVFLKGDKLQMLLWVLFALVIWMVAQIASNIQLLLTYSSAQLLNMSLAQLLPTLAIFFLVQASLTLLVARRKTVLVNISPLMMVILIAVPLLSLWIIGEFSVISYDDVNNVQVYTYISLVLINVGVYVFYERMSAITASSLKQQAELQRASLELVHTDEIKSLYDETRKWRHDYRNHLQAMQGFINVKNYEGLLEYMGSIGASIDKIDFRVNSGSDLLDAIVSAKMSRAEAHAIQFNADVSFSKNIALAPIDITTLVSNLLDNAIEACERITNPNSKPYIELKIFDANDSLGIIVKNSTNGEKIKQEKGRFLTSKNSSNHGIGMQQIDTIVHKYNGVITRDFNDNQFETLIRLFSA